MTRIQRHATETRLSAPEKQQHRLEIKHCTPALRGLQWLMFTWMATSSGCGDKDGSKRGSQVTRYKDRESPRRVGQKTFTQDETVRVRCETKSQRCVYT